MKLHILSDLHIEFGAFEPPATDADVVILAGDIGEGQSGLRWIQSQLRDKPVIYVLGNHEFYNHDTGLIDGLKAEAPANVHLLENDTVEIGSVRFLGCVLWTDFALLGKEVRQAAMEEVGRVMTDFHLIRHRGLTFRPEDALLFHRESRRWLAERLAEPFAGKSVVVTHHMPSPQSIPDRFAASAINPAFASNLEGLIEETKPALWIHGHTHDFFDYRLGETRVVCNPRGYCGYEPTEGFREGLVVEI